MPVPEVTQATIHWATLVPVIVGGAIAVVGGVLAPAISRSLDDKSERRKKRVEKFEELVGALFEYDEWLDDIRDIRVFGREQLEPPSPLAKTQAIAAIYFHEFNGDLAEIGLSPVRMTPA